MMHAPASAITSAALAAEFGLGTAHTNSTYLFLHYQLISERATLSQHFFRVHSALLHSLQPVLT
jgi:hypothetical protein